MYKQKNFFTAFFKLHTSRNNSSQFSSSYVQAEKNLHSFLQAMYKQKISFRFLQATYKLITTSTPWVCILHNSLLRDKRDSFQQETGSGQ
jgi:hypothetical protein